MTDLATFATLLRERAIPLGLVSESDSGRLEERHVQDSARAASLIGSSERTLCDIGSGAGLPGLVIAIVRPDVQVRLIEPKQRAVAFIELVVERLRLTNVAIQHGRVEDAELEADVATTRAFAPLPRSWEAALRVLRPGGRLVYFAGKGMQDPEGAARAVTSPEPPADVEIVPGIADFSPLVIMTRGALRGRSSGQASTRG